ncbi:MAG: penicillin-binding protein [Actinomycetota bacterium]|nr:penicillin-binding protein [Actinomycetota bacterium]
MERTPVVWERIKGLPWLAIGGGLLGCAVLIAAVAPLRRAVANVTSKVILVAASPFAPDIKGFEDLPDASKVLAKDGTDVGLLGTEQRDPVRLSRLPPHVTKAVLAAEDADFYSHSGVDPSAVFRAILNNARGETQGGSTITQQLAKLNYVGSNRTLFRKMKEVLYASKLESKYSKDQLLERYINQVYFGDGAYGIALASQTFFDVPPERLTPAQAAMLAGKIQSPNGHDPYKDPARVQARRDQVLRNMGKHHWLSGADLDAALSSPLGVAPRRTTGRGVGSGSKAPDFLAFVGREAAGIDALGSTADARRKQAFTGGYTIETTVDLKATDAAVEAAKSILGAPGDPTTAIASVQPGDGAIRVLFGGLDPNLEFDPASQGRRQPGSSFKPYVYLAMLKAGIDPRTQFDSASPQTLRCAGASWTVNNFEGEGRGMITVDEALTRSVNVVFAQVMARVGPDAVRDVAEKAGISKDALTPPECAMALGGLRQGVSPLEQASGFATFAAKGMSAQPYAIVRIKDRRGNVVYEHRPKTTQAFRDKEAGVVNAALKSVVESGTGTAAAIGRPVAGKTGTSENYGNAWFVGYTPQLSTAVWVGRPEGDPPMRNVHGINVTGGSYPARIFSRYMRAALAGVPPQDLYTASVDELNLKSTVSTSPTTPPTPTLDPTTTMPPSPNDVAFPTTAPTTLPTAPPTVPTTVRPATTTTALTIVPRPTTTAVPPTTTTTIRVQ